MLVPHFSQVWFLLTPPTDVLGLGALGESFPGNRRAASGSQTHTNTHTHMNTAAQRDVPTGLRLCSSHQHSVCSHCPPSVELVCISCSSSPAHQPWDTLHEMGFHTLVIITSWKNVITIWFYLPRHLSKQRGKKEDRCIPWYAVHNINCTLESFSPHPAQVTAIWKPKL